MIDKTPYTPGMREVLKLSKAEAGRLGHDYIGPEHYMLAVIRKGDGVAVEALDDKNVNTSLEELKMQIEQEVGAGNGPTVGLFAPNQDAKRVLDTSKAIANSMKNGWVGTEHLLLALIKEEETIPSKCLRQLGATYDKVKAAVLKVIEGTPGKGPRRSSPGKPSPPLANWDGVTLSYDISKWLELMGKGGRIVLEMENGKLHIHIIEPSREPDPNMGLDPRNASSQGMMEFLLRPEIQRKILMMTEVSIAVLTPKQEQI